MTERPTENNIRQINFLGKTFDIDVLLNSQQVVLPSHTILGTSLPCPVTEGMAFVQEVDGDPQRTHKVIIRCESAMRPFTPNIEGHAQCLNKTTTYIKYP